MKSIAFLTGLLILFFSLSCKKNQLGGKSTVKGKVMHHEKIIPNAIVYIKFNAKEFPGEDASNYSTSVRADNEGSYSFKCYKGDYYLYGVGFDNSINKAVVGGLPVHIRNKETVEVDVAVTED
jgi:hypothetical protein